MENKVKLEDLWLIRFALGNEVTEYYSRERPLLGPGGLSFEEVDANTGTPISTVYLFGNASVHQPIVKNK